MGGSEGRKTTLFLLSKLFAHSTRRSDAKPTDKKISASSRLPEDGRICDALILAEMVVDILLKIGEGFESTPDFPVLHSAIFLFLHVQFLCFIPTSVNRVIILVCGFFNADRRQLQPARRLRYRVCLDCLPKRKALTNFSDDVDHDQQLPATMVMICNTNIPSTLLNMNILSRPRHRLTPLFLSVTSITKCLSTQPGLPTSPATLSSKH